MFNQFRPQTWALLGVLLSLVFVSSANAEVISGPIWASNGNPNSWDTTASSSAMGACNLRGGNHLAYYSSPPPRYECYTAPGGSWVTQVIQYTNPCTATEQHYDTDTKSCIDPPPPPPPTDAECVADHGPGWISGSIQVGEETYHHCYLPLPDADQEECSDPVGTVEYNGQTTVICADEQNECANSGGTWGTWGPAGQENTGCLPPDTGDHLPTCASNGAFVSDGVDSFVCESPEPMPEMPNTSDTPDPDTDGDGTPDKNDSDLDGDGIANGSDPDRDGDGIPNEDDLTPDGEGEPDSSVDGGADCLVAPRCTGNAIDCAILYQTWKGRCEGDAQATEEIPDGTDTNIFNSLNSEADTLLDGHETALTTSIGDGDAGISGPTNIGDDIPGIFDPGTCSDLTFSAPGGQSMTLSCTKTAKLREILGIVVAIYTLLLVFQIATRGEVK